MTPQQRYAQRQRDLDPEGWASRNRKAQAAFKARQQDEDPEAWSARRSAESAAFRRAHPEKKSAWNKVYKAVRRGDLTRPDACEKCGQACKPDASHDDYAKPLEVEWLCRTCHSTKDARLRRSNVNG